MDMEYVVRVINSLANTKFDPKVVQALTTLFERGTLTPPKIAQPAQANPLPVLGETPVDMASPAEIPVIAPPQPSAQTATPSS
jgi:hypothetical protein